MIFKFDNAIYDIEMTSKFKSGYKRIRKQGKDISKLIEVLETLANGEELSSKNKNHRLLNDKKYKDCFECHITPDWLLIYKIKNSELVLLLFATGSHTELFDK